MRNQLEPLSMDQIQQQAPSVFSTQPIDDVSSRYRFIPTVHLVNLLAMMGWKPVSARQVITRTDDGMHYAKHELRFRNESAINHSFMKVGDSLPEIVLTNSHNRTAVINLMVGLFRLVCSNGLMVSDSTIAGIRIKHVGFNDSSISDAVFQLGESLPLVLDKINLFKSVQLSSGEQRLLAQSAALLRWKNPSEIPIRPDDLLNPNRYDDHRDDLFSTFNRIQENLIHGGIKAIAPDGKQFHTRAVKSIDSDISINKGLWNLAEQMCALKNS